MGPLFIPSVSELLMLTGALLALKSLYRNTWAFGGRLLVVITACFPELTVLQGSQEVPM